MIEEGLDLPLEVHAVHGVDLGRHLEWDAEAFGEVDGQVWALFGRYAAEEGEVGPAARRVRVVLEGEAVIDGARPVHPEPLEGIALGMADRHQRLIAEMPEHGIRVGQVQPSMERVQGRGARKSREGKSEMTHVAMNDVELARVLEDPGQLEDVKGEVVSLLAIEPEGALRGRHQLRLGAGISAREKGDLMSPRHQLLGEIADDALRPSVERRRHPLVERRHLSDPKTAAHDAVESEESGASSARVRITGVSIGQSSSASCGMLTRRASTGPVTSAKPTVTTRSPTLPRATAGGFSCTTRSTHRFSCSSAYLIAQRPMGCFPRSPVVRVAVVIVESRLVLPGYL